MNDLKKYNGYAFITGASAGIGREFARQIAAQGVDCAVVARRADRLEELKTELNEKHGVDVRPIPADLTAPDGVQRVVDMCSDIKIGILINNAGFGDGGLFHTRDPDRMDEMIRLNCTVPALLTRAIIPQMLERKNGAIIMVSSGLGIVPCAYEAVYGATKAFDLSFGGALWAEYKDDGIDVTTICPALTATEFMSVEGFSGEQAKAAYKNADTADHIARITLEGLGKKPIVLASDAAKIWTARRLLPITRSINVLKGIMGGMREH